MTYTPTTEEVRQDFAYPWEGFKQDKQGRLEAFDRWHAEAIRKAKVEALTEAAELAEGQDGFEIEIGLANYIGSELRHRAQQLTEEP